MTVYLGSRACFSKDRQYRYWLLRIFNEDLPLVAFIGANPSVANEYHDDPTICKEVGFAARWGYGGVLALNVAAFCATNPRECACSFAPIGNRNTLQHLIRYLAEFKPEKVVAAWGNMSLRFLPQCNTIKSQIPNLWCLGKTSSGNPRHPLMLSYKTELERFF